MIFSVGHKRAILPSLPFVDYFTTLSQTYWVTSPPTSVSAGQLVIDLTGLSNAEYTSRLRVSGNFDAQVKVMSASGDVNTNSWGFGLRADSVINANTSFDIFWRKYASTTDRSVDGQMFINSVQTTFTETQVTTGIPYWVRLVRSGSTVTMYYSDNGSSWTQFSTSQTWVSDDVTISPYGLVWDSTPDVLGYFDDYTLTSASSISYM